LNVIVVRTSSSLIFFPLHLFSPLSCHRLSTAEHRLSMLFFFSQENIFKVKRRSTAWRSADRSRELPRKIYTVRCRDLSVIWGSDDDHVGARHPVDLHCINAIDMHGSGVFLAVFTAICVHVHAAMYHRLTSSSAVAERPRHASNLSVVSFSSTMPIAPSFISYFGFRFTNAYN